MKCLDFTAIDFETMTAEMTIMKCLDFTAIDFETMTAEMTSACAIGIVRVENGVIVQKFYSLIKPVPDSRPFNNTHVHGITPEMVEKAPTFEELWPSIKGYFEHQMIVAHNASFDMAVLDQTSDAYNINFGIYDVIDTLSITKMGLAESCAMIGIPLGEHHDALCDATACAMILLKSNGIDCTVNTKPDHFDSKMFRGKEVKSEADINTSLSKQTNIVIAGSGAGPSKMKKIDDFNSQGCNIRVILEDELLEIMEKFNMK